jgi:hypothetical protein
MEAVDSDNPAMVRGRVPRAFLILGAMVTFHIAVTATRTRLAELKTPFTHRIITRQTYLD